MRVICFFQFCVDTVTWFIKQPGCLQKAGVCLHHQFPHVQDESYCSVVILSPPLVLAAPVHVLFAGAVYTAYYQNNPPGGCFSLPVFLSLLWALLKASMVPDVLSVLSVSLAHKIVVSFPMFIFGCSMGCCPVEGVALHIGERRLTGVCANALETFLKCSSLLLSSSSPATTSCWLCLNLCEKRDSPALCLSSFCSHSRYQTSDTSDEGRCFV